VQVVVPPGEVIKPDSFRVIEQEGMPAHGSPYVKGNLYVQFLVRRALGGAAPRLPAAARQAGPARR
jgi:hypothetical protein